VRDYTLSVSGPSKVLIYDSTGHTNETGGHDLNFTIPSTMVQTKSDSKSYLKKKLFELPSSIIDQTGIL